MSRLAALKEYTFMKALRENGFAVPEPIAQSRHTIVMSLIDAFPLRQITEVPDPAGLYEELMEMILRLAKFGLIHGDFNEFNILLKEPKPLPPSTPSQPDLQGSSPASTTPTSLLPTPILIDFPQMVSIDHANAAMYFDRDVNCIKRFFQRRFHFTSDAPGPFFADARKQVGKEGTKRLDVEVEASGFSRKMAKELEAYMREVGVEADEEEGGEQKQDGDSGSEDVNSEADLQQEDPEALDHAAVDSAVDSKHKTNQDTPENNLYSNQT